MQTRQMDIEDRIEESTPFWAWTLALTGLAVLAFGVTTLWFGMRDVLEVGGVCAEGGPYVIAQECPEGSGALMIGGFLAIAAGIGLAIPSMLKLGRGAIQFLFLAWPGVFLPLGWNFWDFGISPPGGSTGASIGWIVCGALFWLMALPVLFLIPTMIRKAGRERGRAIVCLLIAGTAIGILGGTLVATSAG